MKKQVKLALIGCGYWGPNLLRNFRSLPSCSLRIMCDLDLDRLKHLKALYPEVEGQTDYQPALTGTAIDAVVIATPVRLHYKIAKESLEAGKHILIEKPMAMSVAECEELIEIASRKGLVLMVGHTFLYSPHVKKIKHIVLSGDIGEIRYIASRRLNLGLCQKDINVAWDLAPHDLSIILHIMDDFPLTMNCQGTANITPGIEDVVNMSLTFPRNRFATIQNSWLDPKKVREMTIVGTRRMIVYDDVEPLEKIKIYDTRVETPPHYDTFAEFQYAYHYGDMYSPHVHQEEPLRTECQHFLDCVTQGTAPITNGRMGLDLVRILEASSTSMKQNGAAVTFAGQTVALPAKGTPARSGTNGNGNANGKSAVYRAQPGGNGIHTARRGVAPRKVEALA
jgi:predicted dehydrogenase